jgi:hypothetical protein
VKALQNTPRALASAWFRTRGACDIKTSYTGRDARSPGLLVKRWY